MVVGMGVLYQHYGALPQVQQALTGMSSVAAGLLFATVIKLAMVLPRGWRPWLFGALAFVGVGVMRWPLLVGHGRSRAMGCLRGLERAGVMDRLDLGGLFLHFLILWFLAIGGPSTILPDIHRYVVEVHHLLTNAQFAEIYTLAQVAPGPNAMYVTLIGWHLAGWKGVAATTIPLLVPATTLTLLVGHLNERYPNARIGRADPPRPDADHDRPCARERDDPDARGEPRLARLLDHAALPSSWSCASRGIRCGCSPAARWRACWASSEL